MSQALKEYIDSFLDKDMSAGSFADSYMMKWKAERDNNLLGKDEDNLSELLSSVFCVADMYNPDNDREEYEFDDEQLRKEINKLMDIYTNK
ncbi:TPA: colicin immunity protein [Enterobacter mori]|uniref:colicin immunity domain-containing protein n=1 Tax=Enterobacter TaxID=547 RepID=UPI000E752158|nr:MULTISPECIES: colicin immunity domain-containing protein [Enterobacter]KAA1061694.1 colicin immunity protein [Enterobacter mori]MBA7751919.1 colicin immunity protein [Enterobacter sp. RHBSTW-01064]MBS0865101.1 colicin immunity protein [Enterobacter mori]MBT1884385.1 colicin immunity protein [Enterobacter mori]MCW4857315.1 colicin immunity domain-containing protein [Enterobacter mori]